MWRTATVLLAVCLFPSAPPAPSPAPLSASPRAESPLAAATGLMGARPSAFKVPAYRPAPGDQVIPFSRRRRIIADHMVYSKQTSPEVVTFAECDLDATARLRDKFKDQYKKEGVSLTYLAFTLAATARALREFPELNALVAALHCIHPNELAIYEAMGTCIQGAHWKPAAFDWTDPHQHTRQELDALLAVKARWLTIAGLLFGLGAITLALALALIITSA